MLCPVFHQDYVPRGDFKKVLQCYYVTPLMFANVHNYRLCENKVSMNRRRIAFSYVEFANMGRQITVPRSEQVQLAIRNIPSSNL
jgi:hypothetical protein